MPRDIIKEYFKTQSPKWYLRERGEEFPQHP